MRAISLVILLFLAGCNVVGAVGYAVSGPPKQPAAYKPQARPTLVIVENYRAPSAVAMDADRFGQLLTDELRTNRVVPLVDAGRLYALRERQGAAYAQMKVSEIAREVGAEQVIYVDLATSDVEQATGRMMRGRMAFRIKVVDAATGHTLWPEDAADGHPLVYETPMLHITETDRPEMLRSRMLQEMAAKTARLFYDWKPADITEAHKGTAG